MDTKIVVIEDNVSKLSDALGCTGIEYNNQTEDNQIHDWLIPKFSALNEVEKILIPIRLGIDDADFKGLRIGLHIRLSLEFGEKRFLPLIFIAEESRELILYNQIRGEKERSAMLLFTPGVYLTPISELLQKLEKFNFCINRKVLLQSVLPNLIIENQRDLGHQLANEWGVFRLAKFAGIKLENNPPKDLYFKYKYAFSETDISPAVKSNIGLIYSNYKALLIDDNADKGWTELLKEIIQKRILSIGKRCDFDTIQTFEVADNKSDYEQYDIIFLDLRLKPEEDKPNSVLPIEEYSGYKLLKKIKAINLGIQVVILTASNKAWNMKRLLDEGADGYYIKESPDFNFPYSFSEQNYLEFKKVIEKCLTNEYLKKLFIEKADIKQRLDSNKLNKDFVSELNNQLDLSFIMLLACSKYEVKVRNCQSSERSNEEKQFAFAFVSLCLIIELVNKEFYTKMNDGKWQINNIDEKLFAWSFINNEIEPFRLLKDKLGEILQDENGNPKKETYAIGDVVSEWQKITGLCFQKWKFIDKSIIRTLSFMIEKRNGFVHNDKTKLDKTDSRGNFVNHDIYTYKGYLKLFEALKHVITLF